MLHLLEKVAGNSLFCKLVVSVLLINYCPTPIMHLYKMTVTMRWFIFCGSMTYQKSKKNLSCGFTHHRLALHELAASDWCSVSKVTGITFRFWVLDILFKNILPYLRCKCVCMFVCECMFADSLERHRLCFLTSIGQQTGTDQADQMDGTAWAFRL